MLITCRLTEHAKTSIQATFGEEANSAELEFKELPYFMVSRSRTEWNPEKSADIHSVLMVGINDRGVLVDPEREDGKTRRTLIPWANVITFSIVRENAMNG